MMLALLTGAKRSMIEKNQRGRWVDRRAAGEIKIINWFLTAILVEIIFV